MRAILFLVMMLISITSGWARERATSYPYLCGDTWRFWCNWRLSEEECFSPERVQIGDTIFVEYNSLDNFEKNYLGRIQNQFILITPNSEAAGGGDKPLPGPFQKIVDSEKLAAWFVQNLDRSPTEKLIPIPIGLANYIWDHGNFYLLDKYIPWAYSRPKHEKNCLVYVNFSVGTNPGARGACLRHFRGMKSAKVVQGLVGYEDYLNNLTHAIFVASPPGNGLDCHRTWEALLMGCYPIVKSSTLNPLYEDLPVVIINSWGEVTEEFLREKEREFTGRTWLREKLYAPYWFKKVEKIQTQLR